MDARYIPTVLNFTEHRSTDAQGLPQVQDIVFNDGNPAKTPAQPSATNPVFFLDADGNRIAGTSAKATSQGQEVGTFELDPATGRVTFTPNKSFVGTVDPVNLQLHDTDGTEHRATYQPTVTRVVPTAQGANSEGIQGAEQSGNLIFTPGDNRVPINEAVAPTFDNGQTTKVVPNVGTYMVDNVGRVTFQPVPSYTGRPSAELVKRVDMNGTEVTAAYQAEVKAATPTGQDTQTTGLQGKLQTSHLNFTPGQASINGQTATVPLAPEGPQFVVNGQIQQANSLLVHDASGKLQGTYTVQANGDISFQPAPDFHGTPTPARLRVSDKNGSTAEAVYQPTVTQVIPTSTNAESTGIQGQPQKGTPIFTPGDSAVPIDMDSPMTFEDGQPKKTVPGVGVYTINSDGSITFTPEKQYVGTPTPVTVKRVDKNGTEVTATYTPIVTKVTPVGTNATSTGPQGVPQTGTPIFAGGDPLVPIDDTVEPSFADGSKEKKIPGQGTYTITPDGAVTFTPEKQYVGTPEPVTVKRVDKNGTPVTAIYSPEFTKVTPTSTNAISTGPQGVPQTGTPTFQGGDPLVPIDDTVEPSFNDGSKEKTIPGQGTYTITPDGAVTFTPDKQFVGKPDPITVKRVDKNGTPVTATYSPEFAKVTPTGKDATSTNIKGHAQTGKPIFEAGDPLVPIDETVEPTFEDGSKEKTIPGQGTYTITPDGAVTFTPDADFLGQGSGVTLVRRDKNGTSVTARYVPTMVAPSTSQDSVSSGRKGQAQTGTPTFEGAIDQAVAPTFADGSTEMVVPGEGTYRFNMLGAVTFVPEADFVGTARGVVVKRSDIYGNAVTATYIPTVLGTTATEDTSSTGLKGQPQTGKPIFEGDVDPTVPPTFENGSTEKVVPGQGTYTIAPDGTVTFVPETGFVGQADGVTVIRKDRNGQTISAVYVPTVTENPVQPERTITPAPPSLSKSEGAKSLPKTGTEETSYLAASLLAGVSGLGLFGLDKRKKKSED
ncbi:Ig-like domain-containing protein [Streptococcus sanguinis]